MIAPLKSDPYGLHCPRCGRPEVNEAGDKLFIRGLKVHMGRDGWESECLVCNIWFGESGRITEEGGRSEAELVYDKDGNPYPLVYCRTHHRWFREGFECPKNADTLEEYHRHGPCEIQE